MNLKAEINNINYLRYMEAKDSGNGAKNRNLDTQRATNSQKNESK